jgi:histidine triad (HIT) family protein
MNMETIFTKIIKGDLPCYKVAENSFILAFLDVSPLSFGHTLVVPKRQVAFLHELTEQESESLGVALRRVALAIQKVVKCPAYHILQNNGVLAYQSVPHVHFHVIPQYAEGTGFKLSFDPQPLDVKKSIELSQRLFQEF